MITNHRNKRNILQTIPMLSKIIIYDSTLLLTIFKTCVNFDNPFLVIGTLLDLLWQ